MDRRSFVAGSAAVTAAALTAGPACAQDAYPSRAITLINPFPPGGAADVVGRPFAAVLEPLIKQPVVIETKAGAAGQVGAQFAASAPPDGYTLLVHIVSISGFAEVDKLFGRQPKFTRADFIPIARFTEGPMVLIVNDQQPYKTLKESCRRRQEAAQRDHLQLVGPVRRPASADRTVHEGGRHPDAPSADQRRRARDHGAARQQFAGAGVLDRRRQRTSEGRQGARARVLLGASARLRFPMCPPSRSWATTSQFSLWVGLFAPKGTPDAVVRKLREESKKAVADAKFVTAINNIGDVVAYLDQPEFAKFWDEDAKRVEDAVRAIGKV